MFLIHVGDEQQLWVNGIQDDFLRFLPDQLGVDPSSIDAFFLGALAAKQIQAHTAKGPDYITDLSQAGRVRLVRKVHGEQEGEETLAEIVGKRVTPWPYRADGTFLGHHLEGGG